MFGLLQGLRSTEWCLRAFRTERTNRLRLQEVGLGQPEVSVVLPKMGVRTKRSLRASERCLFIFQQQRSVHRLLQGLRSTEWCLRAFRTERTNRLRLQEVGLGQPEVSVVLPKMGVRTKRSLRASERCLFIFQQQRSVHRLLQGLRSTEWCLRAFRTERTNRLRLQEVGLGQPEVSVVLPKMGVRTKRSLRPSERCLFIFQQQRSVHRLLQGLRSTEWCLRAFRTERTNRLRLQEVGLGQPEVSVVLPKMGVRTKRSLRASERCLFIFQQQRSVHRLLQGLRSTEWCLRAFRTERTNRLRLQEVGLGQPEVSVVLPKMGVRTKRSLRASERCLFIFQQQRSVHRLLQGLRSTEWCLRAFRTERTNRLRLQEVGLGQPEVSVVLPKMGVRTKRSLRASERCLFVIQQQRSVHRLLQGLRSTEWCLRAFRTERTNRLRLQEVGLGQPEVSVVLPKMGVRTKRSLRASERCLFIFQQQRSVHRLLQGLRSTEWCLRAFRTERTNRLRLQEVGLGQPEVSVVLPKMGVRTKRSLRASERCLFIFQQQRSVHRLLQGILLIKWAMLSIKYRLQVVFLRWILHQLLFRICFSPKTMCSY
jgi:hypothetical protein